MTNTVFLVSLPSELLKQVKEYAKSKDIPVSSIFRNGVRKIIDEN